MYDNKTDITLLEIEEIIEISRHVSMFILAEIEKMELSDTDAERAFLTTCILTSSRFLGSFALSHHFEEKDLDVQLRTFTKLIKENIMGSKKHLIKARKKQNIYESN